MLAVTRGVLCEAGCEPNAQGYTLKCLDPFSPQIQMVSKKTGEAAKGYLTIHPGEIQSIIWHLALLKEVFCANRVSEDSGYGAAANPIEIGQVTIILDAAIGATRIVNIVRVIGAPP